VFAQHVHQHRGQGDGALACRRLRLSHFEKPVGTLAHVQLRAPEIDIFPPQAAQLRRAQASKYRGHDDGPPAIRQMGDDALNLIRRRNINSHLQLAPLALFSLPPLPALAEPMHRIHGHEAELLHVGQHGAKRSDDLPDHCRGTLQPETLVRLFIGGEWCWLASAKVVRELADHRRRQIRQPDRAQVGIDVQVQVLSVGDGSRAFYVVTAL